MTDNLVYEIDKEMRSLNANGYIQKPCRTEELVGIIENTLNN